MAFANAQGEIVLGGVNDAGICNYGLAREHAFAFNLAFVDARHRFHAPAHQAAAGKVGGGWSRSQYQFLKPFGFFDYIKLQMEAFCIRPTAAQLPKSLLYSTCPRDYS